MAQMTDSDFRALPQDQRVAFYGAMFAMAGIDDELASEELALIFEALDLDGMSPLAQRQVRAFTVIPPPLSACLNELRDGSEELRYGIMVSLMDVALADDVLVVEEREALQRTADALDISEQRLRAIERFTREVGRIRSEGLDENAAAEAMKGAVSGLTAVGVPAAAVYFSGSVVGFSAAGITSGLAALGLGFGMVPGIGVAVLAGMATFIGVRWLLSGRKADKKNDGRAENDRRTQLVMMNLQATINLLADRIADLEIQADTAEANEKAIDTLTRRMKALEKLMSRHQPQETAESL